MCHCRRVNTSARRRPSSQARRTAQSPAAGPRPPTGGGMRCSTRSTSGASPTRTATGSATWRASPRGCPTSATSVSTRSGSRRSTRRRRHDAGYDVVDYRSIDPRFGTLDEAEQLIAEARALGLRVIVDLVPNHVSDQHPWFRAALAVAPGIARAGALPLPAGQGGRRAPPNNWLSIFGGPAWTRTTDGPGAPGRVVPPPVRTRAARPELAQPRRAREVRGRAALLVRPRGRRFPDRLGRTPRQGARRLPEERPRQPPPRPASRSPTATQLHEIYRAVARRSPTLRGAPASSSARSGARPRTRSPATSAPTSCTRPSTSTGCAPWSASAAARVITSARPRSRRSARRRPGCSPTTT